jgi:hypothetical protein
MEHLSTGALLGRSGSSLLNGDAEGDVKDVLDTGIALYVGFRFEAWKGAHLPGTYVYKKDVEMSISLHRFPIVEHGLSVYREL